jgi:hypothetical protein
MPSKPRKKPAKKASKTTKKRGVVKPTTSRRTSPELNKGRLREDIAYYEDNAKDYSRRTKPTIKHPKGLPLDSLLPNKFDDKGNVTEYISYDGDIKLTDADYERRAINPNAVPTYIPIRKGNKITSYYRQGARGQVVTRYYRDKIFGKTFRTTGDTQEEIDRSIAYEQSNLLNKHRRQSRRYSLVDSYLLVHPELEVKKRNGERDKNKTRVAVLNDDNFIQLVERLQSYNYELYGLNIQNVELMDAALYGSINIGRSEQELKALRMELNESKDYQNILVELGRRLPSDTFPVDTSPVRYIPDHVKPYYESKNNSVEFSEE